MTLRWPTLSELAQGLMLMPPESPSLIVAGIVYAVWGI